MREVVKEEKRREEKRREEKRREEKRGGGGREGQTRTHDEGCRETEGTDRVKGRRAGRGGSEKEEEEAVLHRASALSRSHVRPYNTRNTCNTDNTCNTCVTHYTPA